ncbi:MAG: DnaJ C-terminal domain-containing protein [Terricaulis sp.]
MTSHLDLNISLTEAVEGARIQAPTPSGPVSLTIPAGANTGMVLRLKGKGAGNGDQFVRLLVMPARGARRRTQEIHQEMARAGLHAAPADLIKPLACAPDCN